MARRRLGVFLLGGPSLLDSCLLIKTQLECAHVLFGCLMLKGACGARPALSWHRLSDNGAQELSGFQASAVNLLQSLYHSGAGRV